MRQALKVLRLLIEQEIVDINQRDKDGGNALLYAARQCNPYKEATSIRYLCAQGIDTVAQVRGQSWPTAVDISRHNKYTDAVLALEISIHRGRILG
jgi:hypothetical protein